MTRLFFVAYFSHSDIYITQIVLSCFCDTHSINVYIAHEDKSIIFPIWLIWNCRIFWIFKHYWPYDSKYFGFIKIQNDFVSIANFICALLNAISTLQHILPIKYIGSFSSHTKPVFSILNRLYLSPFCCIYAKRWCCFKPNTTLCCVFDVF